MLKANSGCEFKYFVICLLDTVAHRSHFRCATFFRKKDEALFFPTVTNSGNVFSTVITKGNVFPGSYKWRERVVHALEQIARAQAARKPDVL